MAKFRVDCTMIYNGQMEVDAENKKEALEYAQKHLSYEYGDDFPESGRFGLANFHFGEVTADYAYIEED